MLLRSLLRSKIHRATVTDANVDYIGSITIDAELMRLVDLWPGERVHVWDVDNGARLETYAIEGEAGSGAIVLNGAAARHVRVGDRVIVAAFVLSDEPVEARVILVDERNRFVSYLGGE